MSPVPRPGPFLLTLGALALLAVPFAVAQDDLGVPADAPEPAEGRITRVLTFGVIEEDCPGGAVAPCWDILNLVAAPGDAVVLHANLVNSPVLHNLHVSEGVEDAPRTSVAPSALHTVSFVMPDSGDVTFVCDVHPSMSARVLTPIEAATAGGGHASVPSLGVNFLAYWVGVIAFAILFVVYGATFFLFKYNETNATTDHWDRGEAGASNARLGSYASLLAVVIAVAAIGGVIFLATRG